MNSYFEPFILCVIMINIIIMMMSFHRQPSLFSDIFEWANLCIVVIFILEALLKLIALGFQYFKRSWNIFDFTALFLTILSYVADKITSYVRFGNFAIIIK